MFSRFSNYLLSMGGRPLLQKTLDYFLLDLNLRVKPQTAPAMLQRSLY
jgi:hypothetical protein